MRWRTATKVLGPSFCNIYYVQLLRCTPYTSTRLSRHFYLSRTGNKPTNPNKSRASLRRLRDPSRTAVQRQTCSVPLLPQLQVPFSLLRSSACLALSAGLKRALLSSLNVNKDVPQTPTEASVGDVGSLGGGSNYEESLYRFTLKTGFKFHFIVLCSQCVLGLQLFGKTTDELM